MSDIRDAVRALRAAPIVTIVAALSLALGIGANTAIFSILDSLLIRTLPVQAPQQLATLGVGAEQDAFTNPIWEQIRQHRDLVGDAFAWSAGRVNLSQTAQTEFVDGLWASGRFFDALGEQALLGRTFGEADDVRGGGPDGPVTVISYRFWQSRFNGAGDVIGRTLTIERVPYTIIGVTSPDFFGVEVGRQFDVALPIGTEPLVRGKESVLDRRSTWWLSIMIRTKPGQSFDTATAALRGVQPQVRQATIPPQYREQDKQEYLREAFVLRPAATGTSPLRGRYQKPLVTIMVVTALVLLIACANIANLLLARATARRHEMSVRIALGASRLRLMRQLLVESLLLAGCGAMLGTVVAFWGSRLLLRQLSTSTNTVFLNIPIDWRMLGFAAAIGIATAMLFGTAPALRASRVQPTEALKEQGRGVAGDRRLGLGNVLVVVQVALSLILAVAAGLFIRTFSSLAHLNLGFDRNPILVANVSILRTGLEGDQRTALYERLLEAAVTVPGVRSAAMSAVTPTSGSSWQYGVERVDDHVIANEKDRGVYVNIITPGWFETYGTRLLNGRDFTDRDTKTSPHVIIVNEAFARHFLGGQNPVGHHIHQPNYPDHPSVDQEIVGYVQDAVYRSLRAPVPPTMYVPLPQLDRPQPALSLSVKAAQGSPALLTRSLASALTGVNPSITLTFRPLAEQVDASLIQERVVAILSGFFGGLAVLLAALGLYGVTSYAVSRRRTELGIRIALGANPRGVVRLVLGRVAGLVGTGVIVGGAASLLAVKYVATLLYGLEPRDPMTFLGAGVILCTTGAFAGWLPAHRASRIDPARVLRNG